MAALAEWQWVAVRGAPTRLHPKTSSSVKSSRRHPYSTPLPGMPEMELRELSPWAGDAARLLGQLHDGR